MWVLPADEALALLGRDRAEYARHLEMIDKVIAHRDRAANETTRAQRLTIEFGRRFYAASIEWIDWASAQIQAGTLQPGGPLPV